MMWANGMYVAKGDIRLKIRDILGAFMFGGEASDKKVKVLSMPAHKCRHTSVSTKMSACKRGTMAERKMKGKKYRIKIELSYLP